MATLTDIGTEELGHLEIVGTIIYQLTKNLSMEEIKASGFDKYYVDHTLGLWPQAAGGVPFTSTFFQSKGDPITDLTEDMAAEQKAAPPMTISCVWYTTMTYANRFVTFVSEKLCISSASARVCALCRISWIPRIFMPSIRRFWRIRRDSI